MLSLTEHLEKIYNILFDYKQKYGTLSTFNASYEALSTSIVLSKFGFSLFLPNLTGIQRVDVNSYITNLMITGTNKSTHHFNEYIDDEKFFRDQVLYGKLCFTSESVKDIINFSKKLQKHNLKL